MLTSAEINILNRRRQATTNEYVFPGEGETGHFVEPKGCWAKLLKDAEIQNLRMHDLRRSMASWMANTGANATLIQSALNHKDIKTTLSVYTHTVKDAERAAPAIHVQQGKTQKCGRTFSGSRRVPGRKGRSGAKI